MQSKLHPSPSTGGIFPNFLGIICSVTLVCLFFKYASEIWGLEASIVSAEPKITEISWEIAPEVLPVVDKSYVEANPNIPNNKPDETKFFSFRDQQAANPLKPSDFQKSSIPFAQGDSENLKLIKNQNLRSKEIKDSSHRSLSEMQTNRSSQTKTGSNSAENKLITSKPEITKGKQLESFHAVKDQTENQQKIIKLGAKVLTNAKKKKSSHQKRKPDQKKIGKRPKVSSHLLNGPILKSKNKAARIGELAIDCKLHPYGVYVQQMLQAIEAQWQQLVIGSISYIRKDKIPAKIEYKFVLTSKGKVVDLKKIDSQEDSLASDLCRQSISSRAPFGAWSEEMINELGTSDVITIKFSYH